MRDRERPKIGEILVRAGIIDPDQLRAALGEQARWGRPLGATLVKLGFIDERELVRALATQLGLPMAILDGKRIPADVLALVPKEVAEREMVIPLFVRKDGGRRSLFLGVEDPGNLAAFDDLTFRTGMDVKLVMVAPSELCEAIDRCYNRAASDTNGKSPVTMVTPGTEELARHWSQSGSTDDETPDAIDEPPILEPMEEPAVPTEHPADAPQAATPVTPEAPELTLDEAGDEELLIMPTQVARDEVTPTSPAPATPAEPSPQPAGPRADRTALIVRALAEALFEKGLLSREELQARVRELERAAHGKR